MFFKVIAMRKDRMKESAVLLLFTAAGFRLVQITLDRTTAGGRLIAVDVGHGNTRSRRW